MVSSHLSAWGTFEGAPPCLGLPLAQYARAEASFPSPWFPYHTGPPPPSSFQLVLQERMHKSHSCISEHGRPLSTTAQGDSWAQEQDLWSLGLSAPFLGKVPSGSDPIHPSPAFRRSSRLIALT